MVGSRPPSTAGYLACSARYEDCASDSVFCAETCTTYALSPTGVVRAAVRVGGAAGTSAGGAIAIGAFCFAARAGGVCGVVVAALVVAVTSPVGDIRIVSVRTRLASPGAGDAAAGAGTTGAPARGWGGVGQGVAFGTGCATGASSRGTMRSVCTVPGAPTRSWNGLSCGLGDGATGVVFAGVGSALMTGGADSVEGPVKAR